MRAATGVEHGRSINVGIVTAWLASGIAILRSLEALYGSRSKRSDSVDADQFSLIPLADRNNASGAAESAAFRRESAILASALHASASP